ncbi:MAG: ammonium transporter [Elusimicrobiota bacterium]|jgi:Amt family ammonium transporter|nr:ammonium transporter [Elusimicrobiota bacterium]
MDGLFSSVNTIWVLLGAVLVFFMQAGFAMVETGFTRAKNAGNIIMKNLMDFCIGTPLYWFIGFGIMFGGSGVFFGGIDFFTKGIVSYSLPDGVPLGAFLIFQTVFCATAATIVSGAMAERTKFLSYCIYSAIISLIVYPISGHWIWGGGWLANLGFHDFAGSTAVHMVGGVAALVGAAILGPRIGKYDEKGNSKAIPGHSLTLGALGVFILWFCWFGFNGGSTVNMEGDSIALASNIFVTTNLAAATATVVTMIFTWLRYKKPDVSMTLNGTLAGLVAITAGCDAVSPVGAALIGIISGFVIVIGIEFIDRVLKVDDPVGAVGVHGICGALGTILTGFFAIDGGVFYGGGFGLLGVQILGVAAVAIWVAVTMSIVFFLIKKTVGLRVSEKEEIVGLDIEEHGLVSSYADFMPVVEIGASVPIEKAVPVEVKAKVSNNPGKLTKVTIITNQTKFEALKSAMNEIGITGMTVYNVLGCGIQKGHKELYRGAEVDMQLLPKVKVEIVITKVPLNLLVETAQKVLYTGNIGDGKIFVYDVENVIKVRTGEQGVAALQ